MSEAAYFFHSKGFSVLYGHQFNAHVVQRGTTMKTTSEKLVEAKFHASKVELESINKDKENPLVFNLTIQTVGVRVSGRKLFAGGYAGAIDAHAYVSWPAIEQAVPGFNPINDAIDKVAAQLEKGAEGVVIV